MKPLILALISSGIALAQSTTVSVTPKGIWSSCLDPAYSILPLCASIHAWPYKLSITSRNINATAFFWTVTAKMLSGETRTLSGMVDRGDNLFSATTVDIDFGGPATTQFTVVIRELVVASTEVSQIW